MSEAEKINLDDINVDRDNLYREEMITDLRVATLQVLTPIKPNGTVDAGRETLYVCQTQLMSRAGVLPVTAPVDARTLEEAINKFPAAIRDAVDKMVDEAREFQRQEASRIVVPSIDKPGILPGGGRAPGPAGGGITLT